LVRISLGLLLLSATTFKAHALWTGTGQPIPLLESGRAQLIVIEVEALLGLWLLAGLYARVLRWVSLLFFAILSVTSLYLALIGESSCGCFGRIRLNPWLTFSVDVIAAAALVYWKIPARCRESIAPSYTPAFRAIVGASVFLLLIVGEFLVAFDNPWSALARLRGEGLLVEPAVRTRGALPDLHFQRCVGTIYFYAKWPEEGLMNRITNLAADLLVSLGIALVVCSLLLIPTNPTWASIGQARSGGLAPPPAACPDYCNNGCVTVACFAVGCGNNVNCGGGTIASCVPPVPPATQQQNAFCVAQKCTCHKGMTACFCSP